MYIHENTHTHTHTHTHTTFHASIIAKTIWRKNFVVIVNSVHPVSNVFNRNPPLALTKTSTIQALPYMTVHGIASFKKK
jgi:hypothetical protein